MNRLPTVADIEAARDRLLGHARRTPLLAATPLDMETGGRILFKLETLQRTGSFKLRGAYVRMARLSVEERARGVVAASAGNHAQGVALGAQLLGLDSTVFMPESAPLPKVSATAAYGAHVRLSGATAMPRGCSPRSGTLATSFAEAASMTDRSAEHQLVTSTCRPSGVTSTYFGTAPTGTTRSTAKVAVSMR